MKKNVDFQVHRWDFPLNIATENFKLVIFTLRERATVLVLCGFFFLFFLHDEMGFVFDGRSEGRALCVLPPQRREEGQEPGHVTQGTQITQDNPPASKGDSPALSQEVQRGDKHLLQQTLE